MTTGGSGATTTVSGGRGSDGATAGSDVGGATATGGSAVGAAGDEHAANHTHRTLAMILVMGSRNTAAIPSCARR
jgi:hypothetical protein